MDERISRPPIGILTLVTAFSMLCLAIVAVLSVVTANQAERLAQASAQAVSAYYAADATACETANAFYTLWETQADETAWTQRAADLGAAASWDEDGWHVSYEVSVDDTRKLSVELQANGQFSVLAWQTVSTSDWTPEDSVDVWDGDPDSLLD